MRLVVVAAVFPGEIFRAPRSWAEPVYPNLVYFNEVDIFAVEMRAAFRPLR